MRILFAGSTGVLGRATLPHLRRARVVGLTRSTSRRRLLNDLGADAAVCDVYDYDALLEVAERVRPDVVVNFITDLAGGSMSANDRARRDGGANLLAVARAAGASRVVVESVAFELEGESRTTLAEFERSARTFAGDVLVLRFGRLWGPGTAYLVPARPPTVHIASAGAQAGRLIMSGDPGTYTIADES